MDSRFEKKVAVITGGAHGIGKSIADAFRAEGANVHIDLQPGDWFVGNVGDKDTLERFSRYVVEKSGHVDYLINNALPLMKGIDECSFEDFQYALSIGVTAPFYLTKLLMPYFAPGASVINISSSRDRMSQPQTESYTAAKGGISALTHAMAISLAGKVRVNSISPGWIDTYDSDITGADVLQQPVGRVGKPEDIAELALFLCSEKASFITGENICVDGGMTKLMIYHGEHGWIVKDFSRFGRNYIELGDYLERIFPFLGVRFISINDQYDSNDYKGTTGGLDVVMKNILYDYYSKDLSVKVSTAKRAKMKRGEYIGGHVPFGLRKHPSIKNKLELDPEAAGIVRHVFELAINGMKTAEIAAQLNEEEVVTPGAYFQKTHPDTRKFRNTTEQMSWNSTMVLKILQQEMYYGAVVGHKRKGTEVGWKHSIAVPKDEQVKDSFPDMYDTSSAGHIPAGDEPLLSAVRELKEELGIEAAPEQLHYAGTFRIQYEKEFHNSLFKDNEVTQVFVYTEPVQIEQLVLQAAEVSKVKWFVLDDVWNEIQHGNRSRFCVPTQGLDVLKDWIHKGDSAQS